MIVIAIMMILMGMIMTVIGGIRKRAKEHSTRLLLDGIASDMSRYHMEFDDYPIDSINTTSPYASQGTVDAVGDDFSDDGSLWEQMNGTDGTGTMKSPGTPYEKRLAPFLKLQPENTRVEGTKTIVMDFFAKPIRYCNAALFLRGGGDESKVHNEKVDLWSLGESNAKSDDDIYNWKD
jgi:type II secretory pathway pseudopilin PulG